MYLFASLPRCLEPNYPIIITIDTIVTTLHFFVAQAAL